MKSPCRGDGFGASLSAMKTPFTLTLAGLACSLLMSCGTSNPTVYVTTKSGAPIQGAQLTPDYVSLNCARPILTGPCGEATLPNDAIYSVKKLGFDTVYGLQRNAAGPKHVVMGVGWPN